MLGQWRVTLRQAEEAAKAGRYEEALVLTSKPDVADHHLALQLRGKIALDLVARAGRRAAADDWPGAIDDLRLAEQLGAAPDTLAAARLSLADRVAGEVKSDLDAGEPARVVERVEELARHRISGPALRRAKEVAEAWQTALDESRRGEFGRATEQLDRAVRLSAGQAESALAAARRDIEARQKHAAGRIEALYKALAATNWPETLASAELVLEVVPEHATARQARTKAWQQIAAIGPSSSLPGRSGRGIPAGLGLGPDPGSIAPEPPIPIETPMGTIVPTMYPPPGGNERGLPIGPGRALAQSLARGPQGRFLLWLDTVGGYLVCLDDEIVLGRSGPDSGADVPLLGDLARNHARLVRDGDSYILKAIKDTFVNGRPVETAPLRSGDVIRLGSSVELEFQQPSPVSSTARLVVVSRHRLPLAVDGVVLMAETCIIGSNSHSHILAPGLSAPVVLYRQGPSLWCRAPGSFEVDGREMAARSALTLQSSVLGEGFSFSLEPLGSRTSPV